MTVALVVNISEFLEEYFSNSMKTLKESYAAIILSIFTDILAGVFLGKAEEILKILPGIIILLPGTIGLRGNIFGSLGSRLGSAFHLGLIEKFELKNPLVQDNTKIPIYLTLLFSVFLGILANFSCKIFGIECVGIEHFIVISFIAGVISGFIMLVLTFFITFIAFHRGYDPDNVTTPLITAFGDFFTVPALIFAAFLVKDLSFKLVNYLFDFIILLTIGNMIYIIYRENKNVKKIIYESVPVLSVCSIIGSFSGFIMQESLNQLLILPSFLVMIPAFLEEGGNIGSILASRLTSKLHLGLIRPEFKFNKYLIQELITSHVLSLIVFPLVGILSFVFSIFTNIETLSFIDSIIITTILGLLLTMLVSFLVIVVCFIAYRHGYDPDNVLVPMVTSFADFLGIFILIFALNLLV